jgi:Rab proteins geranylgeranyltransferase component A
METPISHEPPRDAEGLLQHYDVVLCGTGLIQSILASALTRAGLTVLHCDGSDYYGELDAVWTLPYLQEQFRQSQATNAESTLKEPENNAIDNHEQSESSTLDTLQSTSLNDSYALHPRGSLSSLKLLSLDVPTKFPLHVGSKVATPYGKGTITSWTPTDSNDSIIRVVVTLDAWKLANATSPTLHMVYVDSDGDPKVGTDVSHKPPSLESTSALQTRTILEQRSRSFALDVTPSLIYASGPAVYGLLQSKVADYLEFKSLEGMYWCRMESSDTKDNSSNESVTAHLEPVPCSKHDVFASSWLSPMDKRRLMTFLQLALDYSQQEEQAVLSLNERQLNQGRSLSRPQNRPVATGDMAKLQELMAINNNINDDSTGLNFATYLAQEQKLSPKLCEMVRYALALEFGTQPWTLAQGMNGLCQHMQALGRFGSTAFLVPLYGCGELSQAFCRSAAVYGSTYLLRRAPIRIHTANGQVKGVEVKGSEDAEDVEGAHQKVIACTHVVAPIEARYVSPSRTILRHMSILRGKPLKDIHQHRHVVILPPGQLGNTSSIYCLMLDEAVNVTPHVPEGCTLLHWWTVVDGEADNDRIQILVKAKRALLESCKGDCDEIWSTSLCYGHFDKVNVPVCENLHWTQRPLPGLEMDACFREAAAIFSKICPDAPFLGLAEEIDTAVKERLGDVDEDEERRILESAMGMIEKPSSLEHQETPANEVEPSIADHEGTSTNINVPAT